MKEAQKMFLMVWIPIFILVSLALFGNIGTHWDTGKTDGYFTFEDTIPYHIFLIVSSIFMYFLVGLDDLNTKKDHNNLRKT